MGLADLVAELKSRAMPDAEAHASMLCAEIVGPSEGEVYIAVGKQTPVVINASNANCLEWLAAKLVALSQHGVDVAVFAREQTAERLYIEVAGLGGNAAHSKGNSGYEELSNRITQP
ncbi:hypothetical protein HYU17_06150 [Candidatus Woesearchaeota archaeon]|nr:hypothetical protein [Candidatus Woesearchaeota archaeon]